MTPKRQVLFLCTGNSCRSQLAEALLRHHRGELFEAYSAGTDPRPIHPLTIKVLEERGISTAGLRSKGVEEYLGKVFFGYVVIVCDNAANNCPTAWPGNHVFVHMLFDDPAAFEGSDEAKLAKFRETRDQIEAALLTWADGVTSEPATAEPVTA